MEFILNEKSLNGQFDNVEMFLQSLRENIRCFQLIHKNPENRIYKMTNFHQCYITENDRICDLSKHPLTDELMRFQYALANEIYCDPYWDDMCRHNLEKSYIYNGEDVVATSLAEATEYDCSILSFFKEEYVDCSLSIDVDSEEYIVHSIYSPGYLLELYDHELEIDRPTYLKIRYENTRIDCSFMDSDSGLDNLEMDEFDLLIGTLDKFVQHNSWEDIAVDDGLKYKKFHAQTQFFKNYRKQTIMKFRFSDAMRVLGYRRENRFRILKLERDHKMSDKG